LFGVTLASFEMSVLGEPGGEFTGFGSDAREGTFGYGEIHIHNDNNLYNLDDILKKTGGVPALGFTPNRLIATPEHPFTAETTFTASDIDPSLTVRTQIYELGNALYAITTGDLGYHPQGGFDDDPNPVNEPGFQLTECYKNLNGGKVP